MNDDQRFFNQTFHTMIKRYVWPSLKERGFTRFSATSSWRFSDIVHVVTFTKINSYFPSQLRVKMPAFKLNLGIHFIDLVNGKESHTSLSKLVVTQCLFRNSVRRQMVQSFNPLPTVWAIHEKQSSMADCLSDAANVLCEDGMKWFSRLSDYTQALHVLRYEKDRYDEFGNVGTWGMGSLGSPVRERAIQVLCQTLDSNGGHGILS